MTNILVWTFICVGIVVMLTALLLKAAGVQP